MALYGPDASIWVTLPLYLAAGILGGMVWAAIPALLRTRFNANEILVSLMLTYVATLLLDWLVRGLWKSPTSFGFPVSADFRDGYLMPVLMQGTRLHLGLILAILLAIALTIMMKRTLRGYSVRVIGVAPRAGAFAGFSENRTIWFVLLLSGGLAGLAGAIEVSATIGKLQPEISAGYGFTAIIVAFLGRLNPVGALLGALLLAVSYIGGENAQILLKLPKNVTGIFQGMLLFFLLALRYADPIPRPVGMVRAEGCLMEPFLISMIIAATPLMFAGMGELVAERSGVLNLGVEGMMLMGAVTAFAVSWSTGNSMLAILAGAGAGAAMALIFAIIALSLLANQAATGLALTIFGIGASGLIGQNFVGEALVPLEKLALPTAIGRHHDGAHPVCA